MGVSRDNKILTYGVDYVSRRRYTINFADIQSGSLLPDKIENTTGQSVWAADNKTLPMLLRTIKHSGQIKFSNINSEHPQKKICLFIMKQMRHLV